ncbi:MAG: hypothetical protein ACKO2V_22990 [Snowella sp.]
MKSCQRSRHPNPETKKRDRDDERFLQHTLAYYSPAGIELNYMPVVINRFEPKERKY